MIHILLWSETGEWVEADNGEQEVAGILKTALEGKKDRVWIDITDPSGADFQLLEELFDLHPLTIRDIRERVDNPKIDIYNDYVFLVLHRIFYHFQTEQCELREFEAVVANRFIITTHTSHLSRTFAAAREKIKEYRKECAAHGTSYVLFRLLNLTIQDYQPAIQEWQDSLDDMEQQVLKSTKTQVLEQILDFKKLVARMRKRLIPEREVLRELYENRNLPCVPSSMRPYFKTIMDNMNSVFLDLESLRDHATSVFDVYTTMQSHQMTFAMQRLTIAATLFLPLTFIVGVYGMNFDYFPELHWKGAYFGLWGVMVALTGVMLYFFKKKKWL